MARSQETWLSVMAAQRSCAAGCNRPAATGAAMCDECARFEEELETRRHNLLREQFGPRLLGHRELRQERESATAPVAQDPARRSRLLACLPRLDAGVNVLDDGWFEGPMHGDDVCEASDFPTILAGTSWRQVLIAAGCTVAVLGLACGAGTLLLLGARDVAAWLLERSA